MIGHVELLEKESSLECYQRFNRFPKSEVNLKEVHSYPLGYECYSVQGGPMHFVSLS